MAAIVVCLVLGGSAEALAAQRYASPTGTGSTCSSGNPCSIVTAFTGQGLGDEIIIAPGDYGSVSQNLFVQMNSYAHGVHGQPPPRIHMAPGRYMATGINSRLSYARIDGDNQVLQVSENGGADQLSVHASAGNACIVYGTLIDSVCWTSTAGDDAISGATGNTITPVLRNVTAEATGSGGTGIEYHTAAGGHLTVTVVNSIVHGAGTDIVIQAFLPNTVDVNIDHSNFVTGIPTGDGAAINPTASQSPAPQFVNAAAGDFSEAPGSPTINAGVTAAANGPVDVLGISRVISGATDIGAYEFDPFTGVLIANRKSKVRKGKATVTVGCQADAPPPCAGTLTLSYGRGHKAAGSAPFSIPAGATQTLKVKISNKALRKLDAKGKLATQASAAATDGAGTSKASSANVKLKG